MNELEVKNRYYEDIKKAIEYFENNYSVQPKLKDVASHAKEKLLTSKSILDTSLDLGLSSSSRFHDLFVNFVGVTPNEYKKMGKSLTITYGFGFSPFGKSMIASTSKGICSLEFYEDSHNDIFTRLESTWRNAELIQDDTKAQELLNKIFIDKEKVNLFVKGTNFQINVWKAILNIKKGEVSTYSDVATLLGKPKALRAVATAIAANHVGILIHCHRVISKTAAMSGYRCGIGRKKMILTYEDNYNE